MKLEWNSFDNAWQLTEFVNRLVINKEDIQTIVVNPNGRFYLYYWRY